MTAPLRCTSEPVSWLRLERYHLGELDGELRGVIAAHLAVCPACAACLRRIEEDDGAALPPLTRPAASPSPGSQARVVKLRLARFAPAVGALAVAAAAMLGIGRSWRRGSVDPGAPGIKGGDVSVSLVREDGIPVSDGAAVFRDGERFKVTVTCPPSMHAGFDVVVFDSGGASFPLAPTTSLACGNKVGLGGAFRLTGAEPERVCVVWDESGAPDRARVQRGEPEDRAMRCVDLRPAP
jgi:hypothetical protein